MEPRVSVIMPIYNAEKYVKETIDGILNQTFGDFELLLINDHPTDRTMEIVKNIKDDRIRIIENDRNRGIAYSRNRGLEEARGEYIALMDDDDLTDRERFALEVEFLDKHPEIGVVGGSSVTIDEENRELSQPAFILTNPGYIRAQMLFFCPMANSSTMFRKSIIDTYKIRYQENCLGMEDYRFWIETSLHAKITNFQRTFLYWRVSEMGETTRVREKKQEERQKLFAQFQKYGLEANGFKLTEKELDIFTEAFEETKQYVYKDLKQLYLMLKKLVIQAYDLNLYYADEMRLACRNRYLEMSRKNNTIYRKGLQEDGFSCQHDDTNVKVTVIIPTHNRADKLLSSINSVLVQSYKNIEILIIDDCSTDNTEEVVQRVQKDNPNKIFYYKMEQNGGPAKARNYGVMKASGEYVAFHDDDDEWHPDKLEIQMKKMLDDLSIDMSFGQMARYSDGEYVNTVCERFDWYHIKERFFQELLMDNYIGAPTIVIKKQAFLDLGGFCEDIPSLEDWEFAIRAARNLNIEFINTPLMDVHITKKSVTHNVKGYVQSWAYIMEKYILEADSRDAYIMQMFRHLEGAFFGQETVKRREYTELAKRLIVPDVIKKETTEEHLFNHFFKEKGEQMTNADVNSLYNSQQMVNRLTRYRKVCAVLLDPEDTIAQWLFGQNIKKVAIYGMGNLGRCLADRLEKGNVEVAYGIDQKGATFRNIKSVTLDKFCQEEPDVDAIIVTPLYEFDNIVKKFNMETERNYRFISIEHLLK